MNRNRAILAYSGGLDTSVAIKWLQMERDLDVVAMTLDVGQGEDLEEARQKALDLGAIDALIVDAKQVFVESFVWPTLQASALYEGVYPLATALSRPLIAWYLCLMAKEYQAQMIVAYFGAKWPLVSV